jgi:hypothetical protein
MTMMTNHLCKVPLASVYADKGLVWRDLSKLEE